MPVRRRNPASPDFPHGANLGYRAGCKAGYSCPATPTCTQVFNQNNPLSERVRKRTRSGGKYRAREVVKYLRTYLDKGWRVADIARASDIDESNVRSIVNGHTRTVWEETAAALIQVNEERLIAASSAVPVYLVRWKVGSLVAKGWTCGALAARLGRHEDSVEKIFNGHRTRVTIDLYEEIDILFDMLSEAPVDLPAEASRHARHMAAKHRFATPDQYANDGTLWADVEPRNEKISAREDERDRVAHDRLEVLRLSLRFDMSTAQIVERVPGVTPEPRPLSSTTPSQKRRPHDYVHKYRKESGLLWVKVYGVAFGAEGSMVLAPGQEARVAEVLKVLDRWESDHEADPYYFCRELGMMAEDKYAYLDTRNKPKLVAA